MSTGPPVISLTSHVARLEPGDIFFISQDMYTFVKIPGQICFESIDVWTSNRKLPPVWHQFKWARTIYQQELSTRLFFYYADMIYKMTGVCIVLPTIEISTMCRQVYPENKISSQLFTSEVLT